MSVATAMQIFKKSHIDAIKSRHHQRFSSTYSRIFANQERRRHGKGVLRANLCREISPRRLGWRLDVAVLVLPRWWRSTPGSRSLDRFELLNGDEVVRAAHRFLGFDQG